VPSARRDDLLVVLAALAADTGLLQPVYRVRLERNEVAGAAEMVVYRLARCTV
jgi:hypothetical protein